MHPETAEGWVLDIACLREYPRDEYAERAEAHTTACTAMGHCLESGYAFVDAAPETSVVNLDLQVWGVGGVFVMGAGVFPQNAGYNPTGTVGELAYRAADAIVNRYVPSPGPLH